MKGIIIFQGIHSGEFSGTLIRYETSDTSEDSINCTYLFNRTDTENYQADYPLSSFETSKVLEVR